MRLPGACGEGACPNIGSRGQGLRTEHGRDRIALRTPRRDLRAAVPGIHIHAFSPLEISQGAASLGLSVAEFLCQLRNAGLATLPGTAAEILDDEVRQVICPDKVTADQWLCTIETAHRQGLKTTATI